MRYELMSPHEIREAMNLTTVRIEDAFLPLLFGYVAERSS